MAASLLELGDYNANEVAEKVGYSHYTNFHNMFKSIMDARLPGIRRRSRGGTLHQSQAPSILCIIKVSMRCQCKVWKLLFLPKGLKK